MATVGLELSSALSTRMPLVSVRSRNLILGIATWPTESRVNNGIRRNRMRMVNSVPAILCVISRSKKMNGEDIGDPGGSMIDCSVGVALRAGPTFEQWGNAGPQSMSRGLRYGL